MSDQERLRAIAEREQQATKGPWGVRFDSDVTGYPCYFIKGVSGDAKRDVQTLAANARFIEGSRDDVPYLLSLVARQAQEIQDLRTERDKEQALDAKVLAEIERLSTEIERLKDEQGRAVMAATQQQYRLDAALSSRDALREALVEFVAWAEDAGWAKAVNFGWPQRMEMARAALGDSRKDGAHG